MDDFEFINNTRSNNFKKNIYQMIRIIQLINQLLPIYYQALPLLNNLKTGLFLIKSMHSIDLDIDDIKSNIRPIKKEDKLFKNML